MRNRTISLSLFYFIASVAIAGLPAAEEEKKADEQKQQEKVAVLDTEKAGDDFAVQGEYSGTLVDDGRETKAGIHVGDGDS